ncbi:MULTISPECIES: transposase [unclassified Nitrosomonas]|uniref:transposase n=1 Tax=unclassified Nitrosomonas TaxID=2609265 RepID=UPI0008851083|nr:MULTISPECIES: transposase [unclassified Nitrosomonas]SDI04815.1 Putative transposase of IS4/5 family [Nitrosomonas sp. Nm132]SDZ12013.1 Putative transposase of IS4/5 family [Nitrosomonas sp. Nm58]
MLPKDYPPRKTVYDHYWRWNQRGVWEAALDEINEIHRKETAKSQPQGKRTNYPLATTGIAMPRLIVAKCV